VPAARTSLIATAMVCVIMKDAKVRAAKDNASGSVSASGTVRVEATGTVPVHGIARKTVRGKARAKEVRVVAAASDSKPVRSDGLFQQADRVSACCFV